MRTIAFLVQNGIGFGHIKRTLLVANEIRRQAPDIRVVFISQAGSLLPFEGDSFSVVNFPFFHRLPNAAMEHAFGIILERVIRELQIDMVVEDTHPDHWYDQASSGVPRILLLRRLSPDAFDDLRKEGLFSRFDRILVSQDRAEFFAERQSPGSECLVALSDRFHFVGHVFQHSSAAERVAARRKYGVRGEPLVVVNAGAGGNHINERYGERLFTAMAEAASRCRRNSITARFVVVRGPYYKGPAIQQSENLTVVDFEPNLAALLQAADVAVIRPGHNVLYETLAGNAQIIVVPGLSYCEDTSSLAARLSREYGVCVCPEPRADRLYARITALLKSPRAPGVARQQLATGQQKAARSLLHDLEAFRAPTAIRPGARVCVLLGNIPESFLAAGRKPSRGQALSLNMVVPSPDSSGVHRIVPTEGVGNFAARDDTGEQSAFIFLDPTDDVHLDLEDFRRLGARLIFIAGGGKRAGRAVRWLSDVPASVSGILCCEAECLSPGPHWIQQLTYFARTHSRDHALTIIYFDCTPLKSHSQVLRFLEELSAWREQSTVELVSAGTIASELAAKILLPPAESGWNAETGRLS
ncbi:MAG TPA: glycosyltransferase [Candidatus Angelobacter sp.]